MTEPIEEDKLRLPKQILEMGPSYFKYILMKPTQCRISYITFVIFTCLRVIMISLALRLFPDATDLMVMVDVVSTASAFFQGMKATIPMVFYKDSLVKLISATSKFWPTDENSSFVDKFYEKILQILIFYKRLIFITYTAYVPVALFINKLPFTTWIPSFTGGYYVVYCAQFLMLTFDATIVCGSDSFFVGACLSIHAQFEILGVKLQNLGVAKNAEKVEIEEDIIECVKHHNFLLEYTSELINMFSIGLIFQFFITTYSLCIEIFIFRKRDMVGMTIGVIYCFMLISQLALYCFPADAVIDISQKCAEAIYSCPWYDNSGELKHAVINCIQRSHKRIIFTAGGFIDIDKEAFTKIFKGILSLTTVMRNILE